MHAELTVKALAEAGHEVDLVTVPYTWTGDLSSLEQAMAWRLVNFEQSAPGHVDLLVATKYPSYLAPHPNKVAWIFHQQREVYDLHATRFTNFGLAEDERALRQAIVELDLEALGEARALFTNSGNTADRLARYCGVEAQPLYAPPPLYDRLQPGDYGDYAFFIGRLDPVKRLDLTIRALAHTTEPARLLIAGRGPERDNLQALVAKLGLADRVEFLGFVSDDDVISLYAGCFAVVLTPHDEDYGFTTLEALFAGKPVIATTDSGGVREFAREGETGFVVEPEPELIAAKIDELYGDRALCARLGATGREFVQERASWPRAVAALTATLD